MSRIGKKPIQIPKGVDVAWQDNIVTVKGPKGSLKREIDASFSLEKDGETLVVKPPQGREKDKTLKSLFGLTRTLLGCMVIGVSEGFSKTLEFVGTGYKVEAKGNNAINIEVGFSHKVDFQLPEGIEAKIGEKNLKVTIVGADKGLVGQVAANIRKLRPPEPYKGKGIRYQGEVIKIKAGKAGKAAGT